MADHAREKELQQPSAVPPVIASGELKDYVQHKPTCLKGRCGACGGWPMVSSQESAERAKKGLAPAVRHSNGNDRDHAFAFSGCTCGLDALLQSTPQEEEARDRRTDFYRVEVFDERGSVVVIEPNMLAGRDIGEREQETIRQAIQQLCGFSGLQPTSSPVSGDESN